MNPRVSRSSALASKATGFPIAKIAALLAVGYRLDELPNDITRKTPASFEPTIDYVVVKIPRFAFEKFRPLRNTLGELKDELTTQMKSVGEVMAIGRTFKEALMKALRGLERDVRALAGVRTEELEKKLYPNPDRVYAVMELLRRGMPVEELYQATRIDPWFLHQMKEVVEAEEWLKPTPQGPGGLALLQGARPHRPEDRRACGEGGKGGAGREEGPRGGARLQDGGHLRRRV